ncbi:MAG TPA: hypothetical protein VJN42_12035 [Candidatus Acidoferrum sp.]|nr:hypothetical protein [Candidatus Acidoferrum sp.]
MAAQLESNSKALAAEAPSAAAPSPETWSRPARVAFRFAFLYLILYSFPFPIGAIAYTDWPAEKYQAIWHFVVPWVGKHILHISYPITIFTNGSGDTTYDYVLDLCFLVLALLGAILWSALARKSTTSYRAPYEWVRFYVRMVLGATMISYGAFKVIKSQFPSPSLGKLLEPYGEASPMGLLWTFIGASKPYNIFTGLVEMAGGALLIIPRCAALGAFISIAALANIFMLNMSYDVPVKLYSFNLLLMGAFLTLPQLRGLFDFLILHRPAQPAVCPALFRGKIFNRGLLVFQLALGLFFICMTLYQSHKQALQFGDLSPKSPYYGVWSVEEFSLDGQPRPPLLTDDARWRRVVFDLPKFLTILPMNGPRQFFSLSLDSPPRNLTLTKQNAPAWKAQFAFQQPEPSVILLEGQMDSHKIQARLRREDLSKFLLTSRGFHWINEFPFNR